MPGKLHHRIALCALVLAAPAAPASAQAPEAWKAILYQQEEFARFVHALPLVQMEFNPNNPGSRLATIYRQLAAWSGKRPALFPAQTGNIGQAHHGGVILIDVSKLTEVDSVLAFWLAHEWGHVALGHTDNLVHSGSIWELRALPSAREDAADRYAARFLADHGYDITPAVQNLHKLPDSPRNHSHSPSAVRARNVEQAYREATGAAAPASAGPVCAQRRVACGHAQPCQHRAPCVHPAHGFDVAHPYDVDPWGNAGPCQHRGPCQHALHSFDQAHNADAVHEFDTVEDCE